jgi:hypothetical protein
VGVAVKLILGMGQEPLKEEQTNHQLAKRLYRQKNQ